MWMFPKFYLFVYLYVSIPQYMICKYSIQLGSIVKEGKFNNFEIIQNNVVMLSTYCFCWIFFFKDVKQAEGAIQC